MATRNMEALTEAAAHAIPGEYDICSQEIERLMKKASQGGGRMAHLTQSQPPLFMGLSAATEQPGGAK